jgi:hypothetical protein
VIKDIFFFRDKRAEHEIIVEPVIHELFGFLVVVPGNPETGAHHFIERIYKRLRDHTWYASNLIKAQ